MTTPQPHAMQTQWPDALHWWIDAVGGFLTFLKPEVRIGQAGERRNDVPIMADLSSHHADLQRGASGLRLIAHGPTAVNGVAGESFNLKDGDRIQMRGVEIACFQPVPWSPTTRLQIVSGHRLPMAIDGVLMMGETCILGANQDAHIRTGWERPAYVTWHRDGLWIRCSQGVTIDDVEAGEFAPLSPTCEVAVPWGAFRLEPA